MVLLIQKATAYETDQLRGRHLTVPDVSARVDDYVNAALETARVCAQDRINSKRRFFSNEQASETLRDCIIKEFRFLKSYFGTPMEKWMATTLTQMGYAIEPEGRTKGVSLNIYDHSRAMYWMNPFSDFPAPALVLSFVKRVTGIPIAPTFMTQGVRYGADKWSHFFRLGYRYWKKSNSGKDVQSAIAYGISTEIGVIGYATSGAMSFADLAANYDGYRFYRDLTDPHLGHFELIRDANLSQQIQKQDPEGKKPENKKPYGLNRPSQSIRISWKKPFRSADYVSDDWDEVLNPNIYRPHFLRAIQIHLEKNAADICREYSIWKTDFFERKKNLRLKTEYSNPELLPEAEDPFKIDNLCSF